MTVFYISGFTWLQVLHSINTLKTGGIKPFSCITRHRLTPVNKLFFFQSDGSVFETSDENKLAF